MLKHIASKWEPAERQSDIKQFSDMKKNVAYH